MADKPVKAAEVSAQKGNTFYPEPFAALVAGRTKRKLGDLFGLQNFGVNLTHLEPGAISALLHTHKVQDEFVYVLEGTPVLVLDETELLLSPGDCMGFKAGNGVAHQLINRSNEDVVYIEIGDRSVGENSEFPNDDIKADYQDDGTWVFLHKNGDPY